MSKIKILAITFLFVILSNTVLGASYLYNINKDSNKDNNIMENNNVNTKDESSISTVANSPEFNFQSQSQILMEPVSGSIIYENNADERLIPASVTKVMTLLLIMEQIDSGKLAYTDKVKCSTKASKMGGSQIWFKENEELTIDEALKAICVVSANDVYVKF